MPEAPSEVLNRIQTDWENVPVTDAKAHIVASESVKGSAAIHVTKASIRNAEIENCCFELASPVSVPKMRWGANRIEVKCLWYGRKPPTSWMHIAVLGDYEIIENYSGEVVRDIGRK